MKYKIFRDLSFTFLTQMISAGLLIIALKITATHLQKEDFGIFMIVRRLVAVGFPVLSLKTGLSLAKFAGDENDSYLSLSLILTFLVHVFLLILLLIFPHYSSQWVFGTTEHVHVAFIAVIYIFVYSFYSIVHGYFRGKFLFVEMNFSTLLFNGLVLATTAIFVTPLGSVAYYYSILSVLIFVSMNLLLRSKVPSGMNSVLKVIRSFPEQLIKAKRFLGFGLRRIPSGFYYSGLLFLPVYSATQLVSLKAAAEVGIIVTVVSLVQMVTMPIGTILLPVFSHLNKSLYKKELNKKVQSIIEFLFTIPFLLGWYIYTFSEEFILLVFSDKYTNIISEVRFVSIFVGLLIIFIMLRSLIDGISDKPYVNRITLLALVTFITVIILFGRESLIKHEIIIAFSSAILVLGISSLVVLKTLTHVPIITYKNCVSMLIILVLYGISFYINQYSDLTYFLLLKVLFVAVCTICILQLYRMLQLNWINILLDKLGFQNVHH